MMSNNDVDLQSILGEPATSPKITSILEKLGALAASPRIALPTADVKSYPDAIYHNYYALGLSLVFAPRAMVCDAIDVINEPRQAYAAYPALPLRVSSLVLGPNTTGAECVQQLGEPTRKGGGGGASSGVMGPGIWCEWTARGIMIEFGGARGPDAWDRGGQAVWSVLTLFRTASSN